MANKTNSKNLGIRQRTHERVDKIMDKAESMGETGKEKLAHLKEKASMMRENVDGYIKENPEKSVLIAAGIGAVVGAIIVASMIRRRQ
jgi:ElaB/YqjD/DUF883 family membrane-anchored ribosome-binding protein